MLSGSLFRNTTKRNQTAEEYQRLYNEEFTLLRTLNAALLEKYQEVTTLVNNFLSMIDKKYSVLLKIRALDSGIRKHLIESFFITFLYVFDRIQFLNSGKIVHKYQTNQHTGRNDWLIHPSITNDFSSNEKGSKLSICSFEGYSCCCKALRKHLKSDRQVYYVLNGLIFFVVHCTVIIAACETRR